jgi:hypothetical protein
MTAHTPGCSLVHYLRCNLRYGYRFKYSVCIHEYVINLKRMRVESDGEASGVVWLFVDPLLIYSVVYCVV